MNMTLYEMTAESIAIMDAIEEAGGEITPEIQGRLDALGESLPAKADAYCKLIRHFQARAAALDLEAVRLGEAAARDEKAAKRLKDHLLACMAMAGQRKVSTDLFGVSVCKNGVPSITWTLSPYALPVHLRRTKIELDSEAARKVLKETGGLPEGFSVEHGSHIRIS